jgi:hypothetical protein
MTVNRLALVAAVVVASIGTIAAAYKKPENTKTSATPNEASRDLATALCAA